MEARLWSDIAEFYQPQLRNISGPYDRSYGMDMESYVTVVAMWMRTELPAKVAPLPKLMQHCSRYWERRLLFSRQMGLRVLFGGCMRTQCFFAGSSLGRNQVSRPMAGR